MSTLSIKIGAVLDGGFNTVIKGSSGQLSRLGENIRQLNSSMKSISKFKQLSGDLAASKKSWMDLEKRAKKLAERIKKVEKPSKDLKAKFDKTNLAVIKVKKAFLKKREALHAMSQGIKDSGRDIKSFIGSQSKLEVSLAKVRTQFKMLNPVVQAHGKLVAKKSWFKSQMLETAALGITYAVPVKIAIDFESEFMNVREVVKFESEKEAMAFAKELKKLSREIPLSAGELAKLAASGGQLGIAKDKLINFTTIIGKMSVAFGMTAEETDNIISKLANLYGLKVKDIKQMGDTISHLANNTPAKAKDMMIALSLVGDATKQFGLDVNQTISLVNSFVSLGKSPTKTAAVINAVLGKLQTAREQGGPFKEALEEIGLDIEELEEGIRKKPQKALMGFLEAIEKVDVHERSGILFKLFGQGLDEDAALLIGSLGKLRDAMGLLANEQDRQDSAQKEFENRVRITANKLQLLKNAVSEASISLGSVMLPALNYVAEYLKMGAEYITSFTEKYPTLTAAIMGTIATFISLKVLVVGAGYVLTSVLGTISGIAAKAIATFSFLSTTVFPAVVIGLRAIGLAVMSNPIGFLIAALATGATLVLTSWQGVKDFFASFWEYIKSIIKPIGEAFSWMGSTVSSIFNGVSENSPIKEFEKRESIVSLVDGRAVNELSKNSVFSGGSPLVDNNVIKDLSKSNLRITSVMEEKGYTEDNQDDLDKVFKEFMQKKFEAKEPQMLNRTQNITNNFTISIKTEPNQDVRSIANAVIERLREQARGALFDTIEEMH